MNKITNDAKKVKITTGIEKYFLEQTLTSDIELTEAIFDLIDNSIDAARNDLISSGYSKDDYGLPKSYLGFKIRLRFNENSLSILDNCSGFNEKDLTENTFYTGRHSQHSFGIGHYGLGLKRALLKSGNSFSLSTDNGENLYKLKFDANSFSSESGVELTADKYPSRGRKSVIFIISDLKPLIKLQIDNSEWFRHFIDELSMRYSVFIQKGLDISVVRSTNTNKYKKFKILSRLPELRNSLPLLPIVDLIKDDDKPVNTFFNVGVHRSYKFTGEFGHNPINNKQLTQEFGIYIICNDRVIVSASTEKKHGFGVKWHSEYGGLVCLVKIVGENPADLPWNTTKTDLIQTSLLFMKIKAKNLSLANGYRSESKKIIMIWKNIRENFTSDDERKIQFSNHFGLKLPSESPVDAGTHSTLIPPAKPSLLHPVQQPSTANPDSIKIIYPAPRKPTRRPAEVLPRDRNVFIDWSTCKVHVPEYRKKEFHIFSELCGLDSEAQPIICTVMLRVFLRLRPNKQ